MSGKIFAVSLPWLVIVSVPRWGFSYDDATYYGWRHNLHIGPLTIWWGRVPPMESGNDSEPNF